MNWQQFMEMSLLPQCAAVHRAASYEHKCARCGGAEDAGCLDRDAQASQRAFVSESAVIPLDVWENLKIS